jgi:acetyl esterase/lipase
VDYRLAPEHVFPAAAEDAFEAYVQLRIKLGNDEPIVLAGDSAGGGLVIVVAQLAKKRGYQGPAALYAISPWISMDLDSPSYKKIGAKDPMLSRQTLGALRELYLNGHPAADEMASPVYGDFADFPPLLIDVGSSEVLLGDAIELSRLTAMEGNTVSLNVWKDMIHIFPWFYPHLLEANQAIQQAGEWLRKTIGK